MRVHIAGAGMAGLCAAARARELGLEPVVWEKGDRAGGSMLLSSGVVWRHRRFEDFRSECPGGDAVLQRLVWERHEGALDWLEELGAPVVARETRNPRTTGRRFDPRGLTHALARAAGEIRLRSPFPADAEPLVLATGGFGARLARERGLLLRANPWSAGDGLDYALARGGTATDGMDEFYGRALPVGAEIREEDFVRLSQVYGARARVVDEDGNEFFRGPVSWSENDLAQAIARLPGRRAWYVLDDEALADPEVAERVEAARAAGGTVDGNAVLVTPGVTHTIGGIQIDARARVVGAPGLYAAGADAGGIATGGYASGLAAALVLGRVAAEDLVAKGH